jgi:hypothetical protein
VEYVQHGWLIQPGTYQIHGSHRWHGKSNAQGM